MHFLFRRACLLLLLLIFRCDLRGQAAPDHSACAGGCPPTTSVPVTLPLEYADRHLYATVSDDEFGRLTLLVDTGSEHTSIASVIASRGAIHRSFWKRTVSFNGYGNRPIDQEYRTAGISLHSGRSLIFSGPAILLDLAEFGKRLGHPVDGILGWDFFEQWCTSIDFAGRRLTLRKLSDCGPPLASHGTMKGEWSRHGLLLPATLIFPSGRSAAALLHLDTGSGDTLLLNTRFRTIAGLGEGGAAGSVANGWGLNGDYNADIVPIAGIEIEGGTVHLNNKDGTTVLIGRRGSFRKVHWWLDGIGEARINRDGGIGNGILEQLKWTFDPAAKRIYVEMAVPSDSSKAP